MPVAPHADLEVTTFDWVPDFARGHVRDIRARWACEEMGRDYCEKLINSLNRPADHYLDQPWGQVPVLRERDIQLFESGAILLYLAEQDERLLPSDPQERATTISWLFAALNSVEPMMMELTTVDIFAKGEAWAELRRPGLVAQIGERLRRLGDALGSNPYLAGDFTVADIAMASVLRDASDPKLIADDERLAAYLERCIARPAFGRALAAQLASLADEPAAA